MFIFYQMQRLLLVDIVLKEVGKEDSEIKSNILFEIS